MRRRQVIAVAAGAALSDIAHAQQANNAVRIGYIGQSREVALGEESFRIFLEEMGKFGYTIGQNLIVDFCANDRDDRRLAENAAELVRAGANLLISDGPRSTLQAAAAASRTLPIVMIAVNFDPIAHGYIASLSRPGGNVTGVFLRQTELAAKQTELLAQAVPGRSRLAVLYDADSADQYDAAAARAPALRLEVHALRLANPPYDFEAAFRALAEATPDMLLVLSSPHFTASRARIADLAQLQRLPTMFIFKTYAQAGGLLSYGVDYAAMHRQAIGYVAKILAGAKPADLPVEQPTKYELVVNLKTAQAIGIEIPPSFLARADEVIE